MKGDHLKLSPADRFFRLLKPDSKDVQNIYVYSIFNGLVSLSVPLGVQAIVNFIQGGQVSTSLVVLVLLVVFGVGFTGVLQVFQLRLTENIQQKIFTRAAFEFVYRIPRIRLAELYREYAPELMNRFFDIVSLQKGVSKILINISTAALHMFFGLILLSFYHPFFIIFSLLLILIIYSIIHFTAKKGLKTSLGESRHKYKVAHWLEEMARTSTTFKLAGFTDLPMNKMNDYTDNYLKAREAHFKILMRQYYLLVGFKVLVAAGLLVIGSLLVIEQHMNIGQFVAAEIIILLVMNAAEKIILHLDTIYDVLTSLEKMAQVTDMELEKNSGPEIHKEQNEKGIDLSVEAVSFSYPGQKEKIIDNCSVHINASEKVVVTGENMSGKSTFLQLLGALYEPGQGGITYDGYPQGNVDHDSLRSIIGDCLSQEQLFEGSVLDNITMGRESATFENVKWSVDQLNLGQDIKKLPRGYDTFVAPRGKHLPRSFIQKLLLARSIVDRPRLLLLEDALEHIALHERKKIADFLTSPENPWTLVAVSNDDYLAGKADRVLYFDKGKVVHDGSLESTIGFMNNKNGDHA